MSGGIITTSSFAKSLWPGVNSWYGMAYDEYEPEWSKLFEKNTSRKAFEEDVGTSGFGLLAIKPEGSPIQYDSARQTFITRYQHLVYALGMIITREAVDDDQYDVVGKLKAQSLAYSMRQTKEIVGAGIFNRAFNGSYVFGDGQSMISATHPNFSGGGSFSNTPSIASDLSEAALEQANIDIQYFKNDRGLQIKVLPRLLVVPPTLEFEAERILESTGRVGTDANDINAIKSLGRFSGGVAVNHYLTDNDAWFILTNVKNGLKYFERRADSFDMDNDFDTENAKYKASGRYSFGMTDPRAIYASPGA